MPILVLALGKIVIPVKYLTEINKLVYYRAYVANRVTDKLTKITNHIYCCRSGSAADTQAIADIVNYHLEFHE